MATIWSIFATLTMMAWAGSFAFAMYPARSGGGAFRSGALVSMVGFGLLTLSALRWAYAGP